MGVFIENGYDCIEMVLDMKREHLDEIGIVNEDHQTKIIALSPLLNGSDGSETSNGNTSVKNTKDNAKRATKRRMSRDDDDEKTETDVLHTVEPAERPSDAV